MFSFLSPVTFWLGALLAIPLVIHFLGRQRLRKEPFPSLLLVQEKFSKSMHRHRLKNLLLLLLRTLLILCLLLALANPALEGKKSGGESGAEAVAALINNGAYGLLPSREEAGSTGRAGAGTASGAGRPGSGALDGQRRRVRILDSALGAQVRSIPLIADGPGLAEAASRFGDYAEATERLLAALDAGAPSAQAYLPVFAWEDLTPAKEVLLQALADRPGLQLVLWDFGTSGSRLSAFSGVRAIPSPEGPTVKLRALLNPIAAKEGNFKVRTYIENRIFQETGPEDGLVEIGLPLSEGVRTGGRLALEDRGAFAIRDWHFCFPNPGRLMLAHAGSALASLPSLGRENYFRRIVHVAAAKDLPWAGAGGALRLVYLSNDRNTDAAAYAHIVEFVKRGGRLIIGVGRESDIPMVNRFLLQPLRMGRLGAVTESAGARAEADAKSLALLGGLPANAGPLGMVRKRFAFAPDSGTVILIRQGGEPVLAERDFHQGRVLLWTTDLDDLDWSDLGVAPLVPLLHRAFQEGAGGLTSNRTVDSDSLIGIDLADPGSRPEVRDPDGRPFTRFRLDGGRLRLGPFDKLGLHRISWGRDSTAFAVNLASRGPVQSREVEDWEQWNLGRKAEFLKGFESFRGRVVVAPADAEDVVRSAVQPLWKAFFLAAILLLFLEGLIASAYSLGRKAA